MENQSNKEKDDLIRFELWAKIIWYAILLGVGALIVSCSPAYHFKKFQQKGGQVECENNYTSDSNRINIIVPPAKWNIRLENKRFKDSLSAVLLYSRLDYKKYKDSLDNVYKIQKQKERSGRIETKEDGKTERKQINEDGKTDRVYSKQDGKTVRTEIKQTNKTERNKNNWFVYVIIGMCVNPVLKFLYRKARDGLIRLF